MNAKDYDGFYINARTELLDVYKANPQIVTDEMINSYMILRQNELLKNEQNKFIQNENSRTREYLRELLSQHMKVIHEKIDKITEALKSDKDNGEKK